MASNEEILEKFERDFRNYLHASISYAEVQEPYEGLSSEDEIAWIKEWWSKELDTPTP